MESRLITSLARFQVSSAKAPLCLLHLVSFPLFVVVYLFSFCVCDVCLFACWFSFVISLCRNPHLSLCHLVSFPLFNSLWERIVDNEFTHWHNICSCKVELVVWRFHVGKERQKESDEEGGGLCFLSISPWIAPAIVQHFDLPLLSDGPMLAQTLLRCQYSSSIRRWCVDIELD